MSEKPLIGITKPVKGGLTQNLAIRFAVWLAGGRGLTITSESKHSKMLFDGLIIAGGTDVHPTLYKSLEIKEQYVYDEARDQMESNLIRGGLKENLPMLCICRGAQLLNVVSGGSLHSDVAKAFQNAAYPTSLLAKIFFRKKILLEKETKLFKIFKTLEVKVNSMHTQAVNHVGEGLIVSSKEKNGIVQSIEHKEKDFILGVQFHPEFLITRSEVFGLFKALVQKSKKYKEGNQ